MKNIKLFVMDIDGTFTDGNIYIGENGELFKVFNIKDGMAITLLRQADIKTAVITGRESKITENRCNDLKIDYLYQNINNKKETIENLVKDLNIKMEQVAFIGDDVNDLECIESCGLSGCPKNSAKKILEHAMFVSNFDGGKGAVREFVEYILD